MKIRLRGDAIRLRLGQGEAESLACGGTISNTTHLPGGAQLVFELRADRSGPDCDVHCAGSRISVAVAADRVTRWHGSEDEGMLFELPVSGSRLLKIAVEKDWGCLRPRAAHEDADSFAHPGAGSEQC